MPGAADRTVAVELQAKVAQYIAGQDAAAKATERTALAMRDAAKAQTTLEGAQKRTAATTASATKAATAHAAASQKQLAAVTTLGRGVLTLGAVAGVGFGLAAKAATDFSAKMALVRTLAKVGPADMKALADAALHVGQQFGYTATQVADAQAELVKAGISVKDILGGALTGTLTLAAAAQTDVATATTIAASAMTQFALSAKDVPHIADLLAAGADKALGSATDLGDALGQVGTTAHQFGFSIDDTVGTLAAFAQAGQIGQKAGTDLNQVLLQLAAPTKQAQALMTKYGISLYDASGRQKSFSQIAGNLQTSLQDLTPDIRNQALAVIFGSRAIRGANILYQQGQAGIQGWSDKVKDNGFAAQQAKGKLDSLAGDLQKLKAAFQTGLIETGESSQSTLRSLVQTVTAVINAFDSLSPATKNVVFEIGAAVTGFGLIGGAALIAVPKVVAFQDALAALGVTAGRTATALRGEAGAETLAGRGAGAGAARVGGVGIAGRIGSIAGVATSAPVVLPVAAAVATALLLKFQHDEEVTRRNDRVSSIAGDTTGQALQTAKDQLAALKARQAQNQASSLGAPGLLGNNTNALQPADLTNQIAAQQKLVTAATKAHDALAGEGETFADIASKASVATFDVDAFGTALDGLSHAFDLRSAQDQVTEGFIDLKKQAKEAGTAVRGNSAAALANRDSLTDLYQKSLNVIQVYKDQGHTAPEVAKKSRDVAAAFKEGARQAGFGATKVKNYVDKLNTVPGDVSTSISIHGLTNAERALGVLQGQLNKIRAGFGAGNNPNTGWRGGTVRAGRIAQFSSGGSVFGGPIGRDTVPALLDNGEEVINKRQAAKHRPLLKAINSGARGFADGGTVGPNLSDIFSLITTSGGTKKKPLTAFATQFEQATIKTTRTDSAFIANLTALAQMGFGFLAAQLLEQGDHTAKVIAAQARTWPRKRIAAQQTALQRSAAQQKQLGLLPAELAISQALRSGKNPTLATIAASSGLDIADLQAGLQAMQGALKGNQNAVTLLRGLNTTGSYAQTGYGSTTAAAGPTYQITVVDASGQPVRAGEKAAAGAQRVMAISGGRW